MRLRQILLLLAVSVLLVPTPTALMTPVVHFVPEGELPWWESWSRDRDRNQIDDVLEWKLTQGEDHHSAGMARVFVDYTRAVGDADVDKLEALGVEVTYRSLYLDLLATTMPRDLVPLIATWPEVAMLEDIGKAVPHMHEAVPTMGVDGVWENHSYRGEGITVAVVDTGIRGDHVGLDDLDDDPLTVDPKILRMYDAVNTKEEFDGSASYDSGTHGSHVAGIVAGTGAGETAPDGSQYIGAAPQANLINVLACCGGDIQDIIDGIEWTIQNQERFNIRVMTSSLGEQQLEIHVDNDGNSAWSRAVDAAVESGIVATVSAGNEFGGVTVGGCNTIDAPGDSRKAITVASLDKDLGLAIYSSRGYTSDGRVKPDVATIGSNIMAPDANTNTGYTSKSGTSMATPLMAGIVALIMQSNPDMTPIDVKYTLISGYAIEREVELSDPGANDCSLIETRPDNEFGYGQADPMTFVEIAGAIDDVLFVDMDLEENASVLNGSIITGVGDAADADVEVGVEVRFGSGDWYPATSTSGNWAKWEVKVPLDVDKGNQTISARLVVNDGRMSRVDTVRVVMSDELWQEPLEEGSINLVLWLGITISVLLVGAVAITLAWRKNH